MTHHRVDPLVVLERERHAARAARRERAKLRRTAEMRSVRLPVLLNASLIAAARKQGVSVNRFVLDALRARLGLEDAGGRKED